MRRLIAPRQDLGLSVELEISVKACLHNLSSYEYVLMGYDTVHFSREVPTFQRNVLLPFSGWEMESAGSSETLAPIYQTISLRTETYRKSDTYICGNLKSHALSWLL
jgi:hypothetical protein